MCVFFSFFSFFCKPYPKYQRIWSKKHFIDHETATAIQLFLPTKRKFLRTLLFQNNSQRGGILQGLIDNYGHLFYHLFCISLKWTLSSGQKPVYTVKILVPEQIAFAAVVYFGQAFVFCRLINKNMLEWFLLIMCK